MKPAWMFIGIVALASAAIPAVVPWTLRGEARRAGLTAAIGQAFGMTLRARGPMTIKLLPRPRIQLTDVTVSTPDGAVALSAPALSGEFAFSALFGGSWSPIAATLSNPTAAIDLDKAGRWLPQAAEGETSRPLRLSMRGGVLRLRSAALKTDTLLTDIDGAVERTATPAELTVSAAGGWRGFPARMTLQLGTAVGEAPERRSSVALRLTSPAGSFAASGELAAGPQPQFGGEVAASSNAPGRLLGALGLKLPWTGLRRVALRGDALARFGDVSLSNAALSLNDTAFEGTLGYHADHGPGLVEGTLAASRLDAADLLGRTIDPALLRDLYRTEIVPHLGTTNLDLRLSASSLDLGEAKAEDVAFSLLCHDRTLELTLDEALAFGGVLKARLSGTLRRNDIETHAELTASNVELGAIGNVLMGREGVTGRLSGKVEVEGHGRSLSEVVPSLGGEGDLSVEDGNFLGLSVSQALKRVARRLPLAVDGGGQLTAFRSASSGVRISGGMVHFIDGKVAGPGMRLAFAGKGDLPNGKVEITALASPADPSGAPIVGAPGLPIEMRGVWGESLMLTEQGRRVPLSGLTLPQFDPAQLLP